MLTPRRLLQFVSIIGIVSILFSEIPINSAVAQGNGGLNRQINSQTGKVEQLLPTGAGTDGGGFDTGLKYAFSSNGSDGTLTVVHQGKDGKWEVLENAVTQRGARTMAVDSKSHKVYVATAEFGPPVEGQRRPPIKPGSFMVLVYAPSK